jgi:ketosteroid isomerase-like protein
MEATTRTKFDIGALKRAIEERDADAQLAFYADDAEIETASKADTPSSPRVLRGKEEIGSYLSDVTSRDMVHSIDQTVVSGDRAAYTLRCSYPGGAKVLCATVLDLRDGQIVRQVGVEAWDE